MSYLEFFQAHATIIFNPFVMCSYYVIMNVWTKTIIFLIHLSKYFIHFLHIFPLLLLHLIHFWPFFRPKSVQNVSRMIWIRYFKVSQQRSTHTKWKNFVCDPLKSWILVHISKILQSCRCKKVVQNFYLQSIFSTKAHIVYLSEKFTHE